MTQILTIVGTRPQFVKAAMVSRAIASHNATAGASTVLHTILHTGQHYERDMSESFFEELGIPRPCVNLGVGSGLHGETTAQMLCGIEQQLLDRQPDWVLLYGDTNSTLAGAIAAAKLHIPIAHVEAGLRSHNRRMPEEINRVLTDHVSALLFCPTRAAVANLAREGITTGVSHVGDVMYDAAQAFTELAVRRSTVLRDLGVAPGRYVLATVHRAENTDNADRLSSIIAALEALAVNEPVLFPVHPRTRNKLSTSATRLQGVRTLPPQSFLDMLVLERSARVILTDSGGIQKEAYFQRVPCVTLRDETEWTETVATGWNHVVGADTRAILQAVEAAMPGRTIDDYGDGRASHVILTQLLAI